MHEETSHGRTSKDHKREVNYNKVNKILQFYEITKSAQRGENIKYVPYESVCVCVNKESILKKCWVAINYISNLN